MDSNQFHEQMRRSLLQFLSGGKPIYIKKVPICRLSPKLQAVYMEILARWTQIADDEAKMKEQIRVRRAQVKNMSDRFWVDLQDEHRVYGKNLVLKDDTMTVHEHVREPGEDTEEFTG